MMKRIYRIVVYIIILNPLIIYAQDNNPKVNWLNNHPIDFAFGSASVGMPFTKFSKSPFYPMVSLGTEFYYKQKEKTDFYQSARINYYNAKYSTSAIVLNSEIGFRFIFNFGLFADAGLGIGYAHLFRPNAVFKQNSNGEYEQARDWGTPRLMADFFLSAGYDFSKNSELPLCLYIKYGNYIDLLYAPDLPALPHNIFQIGARFYISKN